RLVANLSQNITAICGQHDKNRLLVGLQNTNIHVLDTDTGRERGILRGHTSHIQSISTQTRGICGISVGSNEAILWNLRTLEKRCKLHIEPDTNVTSVFFLPPHDSHILSCLRNGSVYVWDADKLECCYHMSGKEYGLLNYQTVTTTSGGLFLFAAGRSPFIHLWRLDHLHDQDLLPSAKSATGQPANAESDRELMEVIRLPKPAYSVRRLAWLPNPSSYISSDNCQIHVDEVRVLLMTPGSHSAISSGKLSHCYLRIACMRGDPSLHIFVSPPLKLDGILLALGNDHRVRFLKRLTNDERSSGPAGDTGNTVRWNCLFTIGRGSLDDPLIMNLTVPQPFRSSIGATLPCTREQTAGSYVALLDLQGYVHLHDLSVALDQFCKPPPFLNVANEEKYRRRVSSIPVVEFKPVKSAPSKTDSLLTQNGFQCATRGRHADVHTNPFADPAEGLLNRGRLRSLLREFGRFPVKYSKDCNDDECRYCPRIGQFLLDFVSRFILFFLTVKKSHPHHLFIFATPQMYAWPLFQTVLSELFTHEEWLQLWDTIICYPTGFLIACVAAYAICGRRLLLPVQHVDAFECFRILKVVFGVLGIRIQTFNHPFIRKQAFFRSPTTIPVRTVVDLAHQLLQLCSPTIHPDRVLVNTLRSESFLSQDSSITPDGLTSVPFRPLTSPYYPIVIPPSDFIRRHSHKGVKKEMDETHRTMRRSRSLDPIATEDAKLHEHKETFAALLRQVNSHEKHLADELPHSTKYSTPSSQSASTKRKVSSSSNSFYESANRPRKPLSQATTAVSIFDSGSVRLQRNANHTKIGFK
ncbi:hypothetical protein T265_14249, partial [Opisthorchis viverrini]